jgi:hypothetical protein
MKRLGYIALALGAGFTFSAALAQVTPIPNVSIINPTDLIQVVPKGVPSAQSQYATPAQLSSQSGYVKVSPVTGFSYTFGNSQSYLVITSSTTLAQGTVTLASAPSDGARECIYTQNIVTAFAVVAPTGESINNAVTATTAAANFCYLYSLSNATWDRD